MFAQSDNDARMQQAFADLQRWVLLGHGHPVPVQKVGSHRSKSHELPIIGGECVSNVQVTWFGYNYYFYFLGVALQNPIPATLLYPMSTLFAAYPLSGHVNTDIAPPITNFSKFYHNCTPVERFGGACSGLQAALALGYLQEVSKLDIGAILDVCLRKTNYGDTDVIDGNGIEFKDLLRLLDIEGGDLYKEGVTNFPADIFSNLTFDWFGTHFGGKSTVKVTMQEGVILPPLPLPAEISLDPMDTLLSGTIPPGLIKRIPIQWLAHLDDRSQERRAFGKGLKYEPHWLYNKARLGTREFVFHTPNVLDSAMTVFFLMKVLAPILRIMREE